MRPFKHFIMLCMVLFPGGMNIHAQIIHGGSQSGITLNQPLTGYQQYISKDYIRMMPGFSYTTNNSASVYFLGRINPDYPTSVAYSSTPADPSSQVNTGLAVGYTPYSCEISGNGAAVTRIPIYCSPGTNGVQPSLEIFYNSQSGNGLLGWGWHLSGLSSVKRTSKTICRDGTLASPQMTANDVFELDGVRLYVDAVISSTETKYVSEFADFADIRSFQNSGNGPKYFQVITAGGTIRYYGNTEDSRNDIHPGTGSVGVWQLNREMDVNGNYMDYIYDDLTGLIKRILYTGNSVTGQAPFNEIYFIYQERTDKNTIYPEYATSTDENWLLTNIQVKNEGSHIKKYVFDYCMGSTDMYSLLNQVTEYDGSGNMLNSAIVEWNDKYLFSGSDIKISNGALSQDVCSRHIITIKPIDKDKPHTLGSNIRINTLFYPCSSSASYYIQGDYNGNGVPDSLKLEFSSANLNIKYTPYMDALSGQGTPTAKVLDYRGYTDLSAKQAFAADVNGDGVDELFLVLKYNAPSTIDSVDLACFSVSASGLTHLPQYSKNCLYKMGFIEISNFIINYADLDGDNKENDLVIFDSFYSNGYAKIYYDGDISISPAPDYMALSTPDLTLPSNYKNLKFMDFNGNRKVDILSKENTNYVVYEKNGTGYEILTSWEKNLIDSLYSGDFNGDGKTDLLIAKLNTSLNQWKWDIWLSDGLNYLPQGRLNALVSDLNFFYNGPVPSMRMPVTGDFNGDGKTDVFYFKETNIINNDNIIGHFLLYYSNGMDFLRADLGSTVNLYTTSCPDFYGMYALNNTGDVNLDGNDDLVFSFAITGMGSCDLGHGKGYLLMNPDKHPLLVKSFTDGFRNKNSYTYKCLTDLSVYDPGMPSTGNVVNFYRPMYVVSSLSKPDGTGGISTSSFLYQKALYHTQGKGLLGFSQITSDNPVTYQKTVSVFTLNPNNYLVMYPSTVVKFYNGNKVLQTDYTFGCADLSGATGFGYYKNIFLVPLSCLETDLLTNNFKLTSNTYYSNPSTWITEVTANAGNPINVSEFYGTNSTGEGSVKTDYIYQLSNYNMAYGTAGLTKLKQITVTKKTGSNPDYTEQKDFNYLSNSNLLNVTDFSNLPQPITTAYEYDLFGNVTKKTLSGSGMVSRYTNYGYSTRGVFNTSETDMIGNSISRQYDAGLGLVISATDNSGNVTKYTYDGFGNIREILMPTSQQIIYTKTWINIPGCNYRFQLKVSAPGTPEVTQMFDYLGREIYSASKAFNGVYRYSETQYNAAGQLVKESYPYYQNEPVQWKVYTYETNTGRIKSLADNGLTTQYAYSGNKVTVTDPGGRSSSRLYNSMGVVTNATDNGGTMTYTYNSLNQPLAMTNSSSTINSVYDNYGRKISQSQTDAGTTAYQYNLFGELASITGPNGNVNSYTYDNAGRLLTETTSEGTFTYSYVNSGNGKGLVSSISGPAGGVQYTYNPYGKPLSVNETIGQNNYTFSYAYDANLNNTGITYPNGFGVTNVFDANGQLVEVYRADNNSLVWKLLGENADGQVSQVKQGNSNVISYQYDTYHRLTRISGNHQDDNYAWNNATGNLTSRKDNLRNLTETFGYDNLDRVKSVAFAGNTKTMTYASNGNISSMTGVGSYTYDATKKHAVTSVIASPGVFPTASQLIGYTSFDKMKTVTDGNYEGNFTYGFDRQRRSMQITQNGSPLKSRIYCGLYEEQTDAEGEKQYCYIRGGRGIEAVMINSDMYYLSKDHLGSVTGIADDNDDLVEEYSYDLWGRRRNPTNWTYNNFPPPQLMYRGYTMHEHLDEFGLINMNGRAYDPLNGRFLNPDKVLQYPYGSQSYNPYSYCLNNPLKYTDPSGWVSTGFSPLSMMEMMFNMNRSLSANMGVWTSSFRFVHKFSWFDFWDAVNTLESDANNDNSTGGGAGLLDGALTPGPDDGKIKIGKDKKESEKKDAEIDIPSTIPWSLVLREISLTLGRTAVNATGILALILTMTGDTRIGEDSDNKNTILFRNMNEDEYISFMKKGMNFGYSNSNTLEVKLFWMDPSGLYNWYQSGLAGPYYIAVSIPSRLVGCYGLVHVSILDNHLAGMVYPQDLNSFNMAKSVIDIYKIH